MMQSSNPNLFFAGSEVLRMLRMLRTRCGGKKKKSSASPDESVNPPAPKVLGRDLPDGTRKRLQVYLGGGPIFRPNPPVFDRS